MSTHSTTLASASTQYWSITDASQSGLDITGDISFSAWVKFTTLPSSGSNMVIASKYGYENNTRQYGFYIRNTSGTYSMRMINSTDGISFSEGSVNFLSAPTTGVWYHLGWSKSGTTVTTYVGGASQGTATVAGSQANSTAAFAIGIFVGGSGGTDSPLNGQVDSALIYSVAISAANMSTNFTTPCTPHTTNLVSQWRFDNNGNDSTGSNTLTNNNSATFSTDVAFVCGGSNSAFFAFM